MEKTNRQTKTFNKYVSVSGLQPAVVLFKLVLSISQMSRKQVNVYGYFEGSLFLVSEEFPHDKYEKFITKMLFRKLC